MSRLSHPHEHRSARSPRFPTPSPVPWPGMGDSSLGIHRYSEVNVADKLGFNKTNLAPGLLAYLFQSWSFRL